MIILSIETSCDETALSIVRADGDFPHAEYTVLGTALLSQVAVHQQYGGVFPAVAKREHARALVPLLARALAEAALKERAHDMDAATERSIATLLEREHGLAEALLAFLRGRGVPAIDSIAVTSGPGLEPALWVGINFARALSEAWGMPLVPVNHMEGHIFISLLAGNRLADVSFPLLALLISGGHTELVLMRDWHTYELIGETRDDAVGEAFDKVARMLDLPYPGGPQISRLAEAARAEGIVPSVTLPRPMIDAANFDFSFSGLKTAVLYTLRDTEHTDALARELALEFENAAGDVLVAKTSRALEQYGAGALVLGGGVSANTHIRRRFRELFANTYPERQLYLPDPQMTTDNATMIALAAHARMARNLPPDADIAADGNLSIAPRTAA